MSSVNKVIIVGNLGADPDLRYLPNGNAVCELRVATSESWKDKGGEKQERTEWHRVVVWGKTGEVCAKYLAKGGKVYVEGRIQTRTFDDKEGQKRYITEIVASDVRFIDGKRGGERRDSGGSDGPMAPPSLDDDLPFATAAIGHEPSAVWRHFR